MSSTRIVKKVDPSEFRKLVTPYKRSILINPHAYFRLNERQRNVYKDEHLISILTEENPIWVGIQQNGRYAAFFGRKNGYLRIIFQVSQQKKFEVITFFITDTVPKIP